MKFGEQSGEQETDRKVFIINYIKSRLSLFQQDFTSTVHYIVQSTQHCRYRVENIHECIVLWTKEENLCVRLKNEERKGI